MKALDKLEKAVERHKEMSKRIGFVYVLWNIIEEYDELLRNNLISHN